jgi:putative colanic acid biosynthesis acetyltransferase WcaF
MYNQDTVTGPSFSLYNRLYRFLWSIVSSTLFRYSPRPFHKWRSFLLKCFGAKIGNGVHIYPRVIIWAPWNLEIEDQCGIGDGAILYSQDKIKIGYRAVVSQGAYLCTGTHDYKSFGLPLITRPINIGNFAWVAAEAFIHPGVTLGDGCVVGARSVVLKDMPAWSVCTGNPCQFVKHYKKIEDENYKN